MTSTLNAGKLLVDYENGRVLRADDEVIVSERFLDSHPFAERAHHGAVFFVGPDSRRTALASMRGESYRSLDAVEYEVHASIAGMLTLRKKEDA